MANLVIQTAYPGDLLLSIPLIKGIKRWSPEKELVLVCRQGMGDLARRLNLADRILEMNKKSRTERISSWTMLREEEWDHIFVPHESLRTAMGVARLRARHAKVGFQKFWNFFAFDRRVQRPVDFPDALRQLSLLTSVDQDTALAFADPETESLRNPYQRNVDVDLREAKIPGWASMQLIPNEPLAERICLAPGSVWGTKRWTQEGFQDLANALLRRGFVVDLVGSPDEAEICQGIKANVPGVTNRAGSTSFYELIELLARSKALVCNDSGAMHAASVVGLPTVAIFGPTTLDLGFRPWNDRAIVVQHSLSCRPCGKHGPQVCPIGTHECMRFIGAPRILRALDSLLGLSADKNS